MLDSEYSSRIQPFYVKGQVANPAAYYLLGRLHDMSDRHQIPTALSVASYVFLGLAIVAVAEMIYHLLSGSLSFQFNILGFWIYFGLRRYSIGWRTCALVLIWIQLIVLPIMLFFSFSDGGPSLDALEDIALFLLELWLYRVLTRPDIRYLFYDQSQLPAA